MSTFKAQYGQFTVYSDNLVDRRTIRSIMDTDGAIAYSAVGPFTKEPLKDAEGHVISKRYGILFTHLERGKRDITYGRDSKGRFNGQRVSVTTATVECYIYDYDEKRHLIPCFYKNKDAWSRDALEFVLEFSEWHERLLGAKVLFVMPFRPE
jgi:hypothetical protein